jgi:hypothetical protein
MRTRNALEALAVVGRPLLADAESLVDADEENRILERILASPRTGPTLAMRRYARPARALAGIAVVATVVALATLEIGRGRQSVTKGSAHGLTGAAIQLAGYRFRTPAGFKTSSSPCGRAAAGSGPVTVLRGISAAASTEGGCVEGGILTTNSPYTPPRSQPVAVGNYRGYFLAHAPGDGCHTTPLTPKPCGRDQATGTHGEGEGDMALYVDIPDAAGPPQSTYLVLFAQGLTEDQLIAVAESGLLS